MTINACFRLRRNGFELDVDVSLPSHGVTALFGRSGAGKTTMLRCIAGLEHAPGGRLSVDGEIWQGEKSLPAFRRSVGYVFQDANLFPHLTAGRNMAYGMRRVPPSQRRIAYDEVVDLLGLEELLLRYPDQLSGGECQRVALARALLTSPRLLLMDEPLSALDYALKREVLPYIERLRDTLEIPILYVSHSLDEVARLADHVVLLEQGRVVAQGCVGETLARLDLPLALSDNACAIVEATVAAYDEKYQLTRLDFSGGSLLVAQCDRPKGSRLRFRVYANDVSLALSRAEESSVLNSLPVTVSGIAPADYSAYVMVRLNAGGVTLLARITRRSCDQLGIVVGRSLWAQIKAIAFLSQ